MTAEAKYDMTVHPVSALVRSQSNGAAAHQVTFPSCDCADFVNRRGQLIEAGDDIAVTLCKHIAEGLRRIGGWHRAPSPEPKYATVRDVSRQRALTLLAEAGMPAAEARDVLRAAVSHRGLAAEAAPGDGTGMRVTTYDEGLFEVSVPV